MADIGTLIDGDYVGINEDECHTIPSECYQTISKGRVIQTDSICTYCCWRIAEVVKAFILPVFYMLVLAGCCVYCWQIVTNYIRSIQNPIETLSYVHVDKYEAPGIAVFLYDNATFVKCERGYAINEGRKIGARWRAGGGVASILRDKNRATNSCLFSEISAYESVIARQNTSIIVFQGPVNVMRREYMKIHFRVDPEKVNADHIGFLEFFPFSNFTEWSQVYNSSQKYLQVRERLQDIWPLAVGFITYSRLAIRVFHYNRNVTRPGPPDANLDDLGDPEDRVLFNPINDIVKYLPPDSVNYTPHYENMYAIFEWRDSEYEVIDRLVTQSIWTTVGLMVTAILTILRMTDLTKVIYRRQKIRADQNRLSFYRLCAS